MVDRHAFEALVFYYASREETITPTQWELIISDACGGVHIPGDVYMADGKVGTVGLNIKSITSARPKGNLTTKDYIQSRIPIQNEATMSDSEIGEFSITTLVQKRNESFKDLDLDRMVDMVVIHKREGDVYNASLFMMEHPDYSSLELNWVNGKGYTPHNPKQWKLHRVPSYGSAYQNCLKVKKEYRMDSAVASVSLRVGDPGKVSVEEAKRFFKANYRG